MPHTTACPHTDAMFSYLRTILYMIVVYILYMYVCIYTYMKYVCVLPSLTW